MFIFFIFIVFFLFLSCSNVCALEDDNSTDVLQEDVVCEPVLSEDIGGVIMIILLKMHGIMGIIY